MDERQNRPEDRRKHPRLDCDETKFSAAVRFSEGEIHEFQVAARNVSRGGVALWYEKAIPPGTSCTLILPVEGDKMLAVTGSVVFSMPLAEGVNEIGIQFDEPLEVTEFALLRFVKVAQPGRS